MAGKKMTGTLQNVRYTFNQHLSDNLSEPVVYNKPLTDRLKTPTYAVTHYQGEYGSVGGGNSGVGETDDGRKVYGMMYSTTTNVTLWASRKLDHWAIQLDKMASDLIQLMIHPRSIGVNNYAEDGTVTLYNSLDSDDKTVIRFNGILEVADLKHDFKDLEGRMFRIGYWVILKSV